MRVAGIRTSFAWFIAALSLEGRRGTTSRMRNVQEFTVKEVRIHGIVQMPQMPGTGVGRLGLLSQMWCPLERAVFQVWEVLAVFLSEQVLSKVRRTSRETRSQN